jgi:hypothetical protein
MAKARSIQIRPDNDRIAEDASSSDVVVRSILESNTSAKAAGGFRSYHDAGNDAGGAAAGSSDDGGVGGGVGGAPERVLAHYRDMRTYQTVEFHGRMSAKYSFDDGKYR